MEKRADFIIQQYYFLLSDDIDQILSIFLLSTLRSTCQNEKKLSISAKYCWGKKLGYRLPQGKHWHRLLEPCMFKNCVYTVEITRIRGGQVLRMGHEGKGQKGLLLEQLLIVKGEKWPLLFLTDFRTTEFFIHSLQSN